MKHPEVAELFGVGIATLGRWVRRDRELGTVSAFPMAGPRCGLIDDDGLRVIARLVSENVDVLLDDLVELFFAETGVKVSRSTMGRGLERAGITRRKEPSSHRRLTVPAFKTHERSG